MKIARRDLGRLWRVTLEPSSTVPEFHEFRVYDYDTGKLRIVLDVEHYEDGLRHIETLFGSAGLPPVIVEHPKAKTPPPLKTKEAWFRAATKLVLRVRGETKKKKPFVLYDRG